MCLRHSLLGPLLAFAAAGAGTALADSTTSSNWAGYAVHRSGVRFTRVIGAWTQPNATGTTGRRTYSAIWVGLGGYSVNASALEQIGTEVDCTAAGRRGSGSFPASAASSRCPAPAPRPAPRPPPV